MQLNSVQRRVLKNYREWREKGPRISSSHFVRILALTLLVLFGTTLVFISGRPEVGLFCLGFIASLILVNISILVQLRSAWPALREVINWERVEKLLKENQQ